jgi:hypothetical protein
VDGVGLKEEPDPLKRAYGVLLEAVGALVRGDGDEGGVRDSDLKRKMLELDPSFDEGNLGFGKFNRFLRQAHDHEVVDLEKGPEGAYQVSLRGDKAEGVEPGSPETVEGPDPAESRAADEPAETRGKEEKGPKRGVGVRRGGGRTKKDQEGPPPLLEGQVVSSTPRTPRTRRGRGRSKAQEELPLSSPPSGAPLDIASLGLPSDDTALIRYLTNSYKGVGQKTAERLVGEFGAGLFEVLHNEPERLGSVIRADRVDQLLEGWRADLARRLDRGPGEGEAKESKSYEGGGPSKRRTRRGTRGRSRGGGSKPSKDPS